MNQSPGTFEDRISRLRQGDSNEIRAFVEAYEPFIRRALRFRLTKAALVSVADSVDICQSVLASFLLRLSTGDYEIQSEEDLQRLLRVITNNKFLMLNRREHAAKRNRALTVSIHDVREQEMRSRQSPTENLAIHDLMESISSQMSASEIELFNLRRSGKDWSSISQLLGEDPVVLRKRLSRAIQKISIQLGLESES